MVTFINRTDRCLLLNEGRKIKNSDIVIASSFRSAIELY